MLLDDSNVLPDVRKRTFKERIKIETQIIVQDEKASRSRVFELAMKLIRSTEGHLV